jgi:hypothetical protein
LHERHIKDIKPKLGLHIRAFKKSQRLTTVALVKLDKNSHDQIVDSLILGVGTPFLLN